MNALVTDATAQLAVVHVTLDSIVPAVVVGLGALLLGWLGREIRPAWVPVRARRRNDTRR